MGARDDAMAKTRYSSVGSVQGFCRAIDSGIHGRIHVLVGNAHGMIVLLLIGGLFSLLGLTLVSLVVLIPLYICLLLVMYPLTFGVMYYLWRDVCGQDRAATVQTLA